MEFNFEFRRLLLLLILLGVFALLGGFTPPDLSPETAHDANRVQKAWFYCLLIFTGGAAVVSVVDHWVGTMERSNLRAMYILIGVVLMIGGALWMRSLKQTVEEPQKAVAMIVYNKMCWQSGAD